MKELTNTENTDRPVNSGDIRIAKLNVLVLFEWSDQIIDEYDDITGEPVYTSGFIMKVLPNQKFIYHGIPSVFVAEVEREPK